MRTETIRTARLVLRRLREEDAAALYRNCSSDRETVRFLTRRADSCPEETENLVRQWAEAYGQDDFFLWGIEYEGEIVGTVNLHDVSRADGCCGIGYSIGSRWWNRGIMTEAVRAVTAHAFEKLNLRRIAGWCAEGNAASARVMEKAGMRPVEGGSVFVTLGDGSCAARRWYAVRVDDWRGEENS